MRKKTISAPFELMITIIERGKSEKVIDILKAHDCNYNLITLGEGTAKSQAGDIFGFGIVEREIIWSLVNPLMSSRILETLNNVLELTKPARGIAMTIPTNSASNLMLDILGINY